MARCPVCAQELLRDAEKHQRKIYFECPRCGRYALSDEAHTDLGDWLRQYETNGRAVLSHVINQMSAREQWPLVTTFLIEDILKNTSLPKPPEQMDRLVMWLGDRLPTLGSTIDNDELEPAIAWTGAGDRESLAVMVQEVNLSGYVAGEVLGNMSPPQVYSLRLTLLGWERYEELKRGLSTSRNAFLAMKFGDAELDAIFDNHFKPAVEATGFKLNKLNENQPAGLIDDRLRVEIRQSRFLVADLTHHNNGAYWEAGFAEGLGKPVIYTCRKDVFEDNQQGTHFDTNHHLTVPWDPENMAEAVNKIKATIRATLPGEAKMED